MKSAFNKNINFKLSSYFIVLQQVKALLIPYGDLEKFVLLRDRRNNTILGYAFSVLKNVSLTDQVNYKSIKIILK